MGTHAHYNNAHRLMRDQVSNHRVHTTRVTVPSMYASENECANSNSLGVQGDALPYRYKSRTVWARRQTITPDKRASVHVSTCPIV